MREGAKKSIFIFMYSERQKCFKSCKKTERFFKAQTLEGLKFNRLKLRHSLETVFHPCCIQVARVSLFLYSVIFGFIFYKLRLCISKNVKFLKKFDVLP